MESFGVDGTIAASARALDRPETVWEDPEIAVVESRREK
jgi:hypothetical protein